MRCALREVRDEDLAVLFEQWADPVAARMAAFTAPDHMDRDAFERRWSRLRADETVIARAIVVDGEVAGTIGSWGDPGEREVTYWIGRSHPVFWFAAITRSAPKSANPSGVDPSLTRRGSWSSNPSLTRRVSSGDGSN
jgi:RimJ/RimL family protein N-acetyltransferase